MEKGSRSLSIWILVEHVIFFLRNIKIQLIHVTKNSPPYIKCFFQKPKALKVLSILTQRNMSWRNLPDHISHLRDFHSYC